MEPPLTQLVETVEVPELPETVALWAALWVEDVVYAAQYWTVAGIRAAFNGFVKVKRHPGAIIAALVLATGSALALDVHNILVDAQCLTAQFDLGTIANSVERYQEQTGDLPVRLEQLVPNQLRDLHPDPWGRNYVSFRGPGGFAVVSAGRDGVLGTEDDIVRVIPKP